MGASILVGFGALALVVAGVGLFGSVSYDIAQRSREWAVRVALGADPAAIVACIVGRSLTVVLIGVVPGLVIAAAIGRWIQPLLYRTSALDPLSFAAAGPDALRRHRRQHMAGAQRGPHGSQHGVAQRVNLLVAVRRPAPARFSTPGTQADRYCRGTSAIARSGPPEPPSIFIGSAMSSAPRTGSWSRLVRFSKPGTFRAAATRWTWKSVDRP